MQEGIATGQTIVGGMPDFEGESRSSTFYSGGPGKIIPCMKCKDCGWSVSPPKETEYV